MAVNRENKNVVADYKYAQTLTNTKIEHMFKGLDVIIELSNYENAIKQHKKKHILTSTKHTLAVIIRKKQTKHNLFNYLLAVCFSPVKPTLLESIQNTHLTTCPGIEYTFMSRHMPENLYLGK